MVALGSARETRPGTRDLLELKVISIEAATPRVRRIELASASGAPLPAFTAGAHIDIDLPNGEQRSYSLLNDQSETHRYVLGVLREAQSAGGSAYLHDALKVGDALKSSTPSNDFPLYEAGDVNCLHQDVYGEHVFPLQVAVLLSQPGGDFTGGEFVLSEQRPRRQSRAEVVALEQGQGVIFPVRERPLAGPRGFSRAQLRHGVSRIRTGRRHTLGIIFHDAAT